MPVTLTKAQVNKLLIAERAKSRTKQQNSAFMRRSLSIYNAQTKRMREHRPVSVNASNALPYTLAEFRVAMQKALDGAVCCYCGCKLTVKKVTPDHKHSIALGGSWDLDNICFSCQSCNWQKGILDAEEFRSLLQFCKYLTPDSAADVKRRLSIGGKWSPGR